MVGTRSQKVRPHQQAARVLLEAREQRGLEIEQVAKEIGVTARKLEALEEGDFSGFAAEIYGRGTYLAYAKYLGIDRREAERLVSQALSQARERVPLTMHTPSTWLERVMTPKMLIMASLVFVALIVGGYITWQVQEFIRLPRLRVTEPAVAVLENSQLLVQGVAEENARVVVNGVPVLLGENGHFEYKISLHPGINVLLVEAENAAGRKRVIEKHLLLPRSQM